jgi:Fe-S cluster biogenesis protein NfuA
MNKIEKIKEIINEVKPFIENDGGDIEFIKYEDNIVYVNLSGACSNCPMAEITLKDGVESLIINEIPEVKAVVNIKKN